MPLNRLIPSLLFTTLACAGGCEFLDQFEDGGGIVDVFAVHHPTARDGEFPTHPGDHFELENDQGWTVIVVDAYVTTTAVVLNRCDGDQIETDFYWGPLCEDLIGGDLQARGLGAVFADEGTYCSATVTYGPLTGSETGHGTDADVLGATVLLSGVAKKGEESIPFTFQSFDQLAVDVDLSTVEDGGPLTLDHDQMFNEKLTFAKTYDRFFDGIDFAELTDYDTGTLVLDTVAFETRAVHGVDVVPE